MEGWAASVLLAPPCALVGVLGLGVRVRVLGLGVRGEGPIFWRAGEGQVRVKTRYHPRFS